MRHTVTGQGRNDDYINTGGSMVAGSHELLQEVNVGPVANQATFV